MTKAVSMIALAALASLLSGCGCSREKKLVAEGAVDRMQDAEYTNRLAGIRSGQVDVASKAAAIRSEIEKLGRDAESHGSYADLTNRLAKCELEMEQLRKSARQAVMGRILKNAAEKGNLKK